jgi:hypothetical protein
MVDGIDLEVLEQATKKQVCSASAGAVLGQKS